jgi:hypothetical protein
MAQLHAELGGGIIHTPSSKVWDKCWLRLEGWLKLRLQLEGRSISLGRMCKLRLCQNIWNGRSWGAGEALVALWRRRCRWWLWDVRGMGWHWVLERGRRARVLGHWSPSLVIHVVYTCVYLPRPTARPSLGQCPQRPAASPAFRYPHHDARHSADAGLKIFGFC